MHLALQVEDVVAEICSWLGGRDLARLLRVAKLFKSTAQRELWRTFATFEALLFALPDPIVARRATSSSYYLKFTKLARPSDWTEPRKLASMIRVLDQPRITYLTATTILELLSNGPTTSISAPLCPHIHTLIWTAFDRTHVYAARLFTCPSLKLIRLTLGDSVASDSDAIGVFLEHVSLTSPTIESLEIVSSTPGTLAIIISPPYLANYSNLRSINLHFSLISDAILQSLSTLAHLHTLRARISSRQPAISLYRPVTIKSLRTLGLAGGRDALVDLLQKIQNPNLTAIELSINDLTSDAALLNLSVYLQRRMKQILTTHISLTHDNSSIDVTSGLSFCTPMTHEFVLRASFLSSTALDSSAVFLGLQRMTLRATAGWRQALPVLKLPDVLRCFPSLTHLEMGLDARFLSIPSPDLSIQQSSLKTLVIYPGPIHSALPTASFLNYALPYTSITIESVPDIATAWDDVVAACSLLRQLVQGERHCTELEQENAQLRERLDRQQQASVLTPTIDRTEELYHNAGQFNYAI